MRTEVVQAICRLSRIDTCLLVFLTVFAPSYAHDENLLQSLILALPVFTMCICTFIINDVNDLEKDIVNHPNRPLPKKKLTVAFAVALYFLFIFLSLILVKIYVPADYVYIYLLFLILLTNYDYMVATFPYIKNFYVSVTTVIPIAILSYISPGNYDYAYVASALIFFTLGREMFMDIEDVKGDGETFVKALGLKRSPIVASVSQWVGVAILACAVSNQIDALAVAILALTLSAIQWVWNKSKSRERLIFYMKSQMLIGIYFLF
jgi:geranylgeranylglycerol-phosphate geranylgeranyltransferase